MRCLAGAILVASAAGCSNLLVSKGASADGSTIAAYNSDDMSLFGSLDLRPAAQHAPDAMRDVWDWDGQYYTGQIPEAAQTYNVVGNINDQGVIIVETTFGGRGDLSGTGTGAIMSYGDLMFVALQRSSSARQAIAVMDDLCQRYGYESQGESFGVADADEVWLVELIGKGKYAKGAVWVASRVPEGFIGSTANQARTETFNQTDSDNVMFSADIVAFARSIGAYNGTLDANFNFREAFDPISFSGARFGEARVWNLLNPLCGGCLASHLDFVQGRNLANSMPLFVRAAAKLTLNDTIVAMRTHFEGTWFDNTGLARPDVGAESGNSPYRFRPLVWESGGQNYLNERTVGVQQSGWAFIAQSRGWMPAPVRALVWFAPDDSSTSPRVPVYGGATRIPAAFGSLVGQTPGGGVPYAPVADGFTMSLDCAFWVWNLVGNMAFSERYGSARASIIANVDAAQARMAAAAAKADTDFAALYPADPAAAVELVTAFGEATGQAMVAEWLRYWYFLFATYRDGGILTPSTAQQCTGGQKVNCTAKLQPEDHEVGYTDAWRARIVADSDNAVRYLVPAAASPEQEAREAAKRTVVAGKRRGNRVVISA